MAKIGLDSYKGIAKEISDKSITLVKNEENIFPISPEKHKRVLLVNVKGMLQPGESQTVTVTFSIEDMASYDENNAKAYVLEKGDYVISINSDSHTVLDQKTYTAFKKRNILI